MAAYVQTLNRPQSMHQHFSNSHPSTSSQRRHASRQRFVTEFSQCLFDFVIQLLPTQEEMAVKEDVRKLLERLIRTIEPDSRLLSFGSTANGFSLRNSDMDLCCLIDSEELLNATDLVTMLGDLLERETKFHVKPLPHARIPIVKLSLDPSPGLPLGIACDIGFENRLALENTRLLMCYAMIDPTRVRTMVLFLKVWCKRRKINSPYKGTLSSYGYVLLVIFFLVHVKNPPVLPNLQQIPPLRPISHEETHLQGHNIWFFDDIALLRQRWHSSNSETVAELLIDFFRYYSRDFPYNTGVASIKSGLLKKESKGWQNDLDSSRYNDSRERNRFCIEDPFEVDFNVSRCVTKDGLYTVRGEFMRASRILASRPERAIIALALLCEEPMEEELVRPSVSSPLHSTVIPPRLSPLSPLPPQSPYTVGSNSLRPNRLSGLEKLTPRPRVLELGTDESTVPQVPTSPPPSHMAPKRGKWTSPPPPEAPPSVHACFEDQLDVGLALATSSTDARENEAACTSSSNSEIMTDDEAQIDVADSDDALSVRSFTDESPFHYQEPGPSTLVRKPSLPHQDERPFYPRTLGAPGVGSGSFQAALRARGRLSTKQDDGLSGPQFNKFSKAAPGAFVAPRTDPFRRSSSGPPRTSNKALLSSVQTRIHNTIPTPPAPYPIIVPASQSSSVFYQTSPARDKTPYFANVYPLLGPRTSLYPQYQPQHYHVDTVVSTPDDQLSTHPASKAALSLSERVGLTLNLSDQLPEASTSTVVASETYKRPSHSHTHSTATITPFTPTVYRFSQGVIGKQHPPTSRPPSRALEERVDVGTASPLASVSTPSVSPTSSVSSHYPASLSPSSTSPPSPSHSPQFPEYGSGHSPLSRTEASSKYDQSPLATDEGEGSGAVTASLDSSRDAR